MNWSNVTQYPFKRGYLEQVFTVDIVILVIIQVIVF